MTRDGTRGGVRPRIVGGRKPLASFFIVCEGTKTEPQYFEGFRLPSISVKVVGTGRNTRSLVEEAIRRREEGYDHYWCVFDRDSFPAQNFNTALEKARRAGFQVAYSNEAFEIWYLLHFEYYTSATSRDLYADKLSQRLGRPYKKNDETIFMSLRDRLPDAIKNARNLLTSYGANHNPEKDNPCTTVHLLVEQLMAAKGAPTPP
ncbi:RloB domain-containing protein [Polyangium spumosum]|uniref:RloB domain-containing protein n=1 Tax=Polyangium spumosum TaxID=889282 RepID=A0A6N7PT22_9BACT|nr:RloB domain-containing protein [Polyangium spumosum]